MRIMLNIIIFILSTSLINNTRRLPRFDVIFIMTYGYSRHLVHGIRVNTPYPILYGQKSKLRLMPPKGNRQPVEYWMGELKSRAVHTVSRERLADDVILDVRG